MLINLLYSDYDKHRNKLIHIGRVPMDGEKIMMKDDIFTVLNVLHLGYDERTKKEPWALVRCITAREEKRVQISNDR